VNKDRKSFPPSLLFQAVSRNKAFLVKTAAAVVLAVIAFSLIPHISISNAADNNLPRLTVDKTYSIPSSPTTSGVAALILGDAPTAVAWSPDGKKIAAFSSYGQNLAIWNAGGDLIKVLHPYMNYLNNSLEFLNDDELLTPPDAKSIPFSQQHAIFDIWSIDSASILKKVDGPYPGQEWSANRPTAYALSPDRSLVAVLTDVSGRAKPGPEMLFDRNPVAIYSTKTWQIVQSLPVANPNSVAFSPDGTQVAFGAFGGKITIYDTATWRLLKSIIVCEGAFPAISTMAYSPDGRYIVAGMTVSILYKNNKPINLAGLNTCTDQIIRISDGALIGNYPDASASAPHKVIWHPSGKFIAITPPGTKIRLWDPNRPDDLGTTINNVRSLCLAFSPDGRRLASCSEDGIIVFNINF
jgi:WD40 repeat protein